MSLAIANLQKQKQKEEVRARLLADETIQGRIAFRAFEIYQRHGDGHGGALNNWLQAEDEIVSSLVEQELQLSSASTDRKGFKGDLGKSPEPRSKPGNKSPSRAASASDTAAKRKAKTNEAAPSSAKTVKSEISATGATKKPSGTRVKRKERSEVESQSV